MSPLVSRTTVSYQPSPGSSRAITTWPGAISSQFFGGCFWPFGDEGFVESLAAAACVDGWSPCEGPPAAATSLAYRSRRMYGTNPRPFAWIRPAGRRPARSITLGPTIGKTWRLRCPAALVARLACFPGNRAAFGFPFSSTPNNTTGTAELESVCRCVAFWAIAGLLESKRPPSGGPVGLQHRRSRSSTRDDKTTAATCYTAQRISCNINILQP